MSSQKFSSFIEDILKNEEFLEENQLTVNKLEDNIIQINKKIAHSKNAIENLKKDIVSLTNEENELKTKIIITETQLKGVEQVVADLIRNKNEEEANLEDLENKTREGRRAFCDAVLEFSENYGLVNFVQHQYQASIREQMQIALCTENYSPKENTNNDLNNLEDTLKQGKEKYKAVQEELNNLLQLNENLEMEYLYGNEFERLRNDLKRLRDEIEKLQTSIQRCEMDEELNNSVKSQTNSSFRNNMSQREMFQLNTVNNTERPQMLNKEEKRGKWTLRKKCNPNNY